MPTDIGTPPLQSNLPVQGGSNASWPKPWGNWMTQIWQAIAYGWQWRAITVDAAYTVQLTDSLILINDDITVKLPKVRDVGPKRITVKVINAGGGTRTVSGNGANIDGAATVSTTTQFHSWDFVNDGSSYFIV